MTDQEHLLERRFQELAQRAFHQGCWVYSEFLNLAEQALLRRTLNNAPYPLDGGYDEAERKIAVFGSEAELGYPAQPPLIFLRIAPTAPKFAGILTHRDFLGALMHLGIRREVLGDIVLCENSGYLICLDSIAGYIIQELHQVKHAPVSVEMAEQLPPQLCTKPPVTEVVAASARIDAVLAAVYHLSRAESQRLLQEGRVLINGLQIYAAATSLTSGDLVSVRGTGRFQYEGPLSETRKGRLRLGVRVY